MAPAFAGAMLSFWGRICGFISKKTLRIVFSVLATVDSRRIIDYTIYGNVY